MRDLFAKANRQGWSGIGAVGIIPGSYQRKLAQISGSNLTGVLRRADQPHATRGGKVPVSWVDRDPEKPRRR